MHPMHVYCRYTTARNEEHGGYLINILSECPGCKLCATARSEQLSTDKIMPYPTTKANKKPRHAGGANR